jgi:Sulfotransferase family
MVSTIGLCVRQLSCVAGKCLPGGYTMEDEYKNISPVFVVGIMRSGTTLMSMMLSSHPAIAIAPDIHYIAGWVQRHRQLRLSQPADFERFWKAFSGNKRFGYLGLDAGAVRRYIEANQRYSFRGVYLSTLETFAASLQKRRWGEKAPFTADHLDTLFSWFPDARVIYMLRDPRAVVGSLRKLPWLAKVGVKAHALLWANGVGRALANEGDARIMRVRYESLVHDPTGILEDVCRFLGEAYSPAMLEGRHTLRTSTLRDREGWETAHLSAALGPVHEMSVAKWKHELTPAEVDWIEHYCGSVMQQAGYSRVGDSLSAGRQARMRLEDRGLCESSPGK